MRTGKRIQTIWKCRKELLLECKLKIDLIAFQKTWRERNAHNSTVAGRKFDIEKVTVGEKTYGTLNVHCWDNPEERLEIGSYCSIAEDVHFILGGEHPTNRISTFPFMVHVFESAGSEATGTKGPIIVGDDVWICYGVTILSGVSIGKGSIIGAGSLVTKDVPPYAIIKNGKVAGYRVPEAAIDKLESLDLQSCFKDKSIDNVQRLLDTAVTTDNVDEMINELK